MPLFTEELLSMTAETWPVTAKQYPILARLPQTEDTRRAYGIAHANLHIQATCGEVARVIEPSDHSGRPADILENPDLKKLAIKQVLNALRLAELAGVTGEDIESELRMRLSEHIPVLY